MNSFKNKVACIGSIVLMIISSIALSACVLGSTVLRETEIARKRGETEQEAINETAHQIRDNLYAPADAVVLDEIQTDNLLAYGPGCVGTVIQVAYGVNRSFDEVLVEYDHALLEDGWILRPAYRHVEGYAVYSKEPHVEVDINRTSEDEITIVPTPTLATRRQFLTMYTITITYTEPSNKECIG